jgi:formate dehydrogenase iron-sulfur subunit
MTQFAPENGRTLIDELLEDQRKLTAVERFAVKHERNHVPIQAKYYRDLIPLALPKAGEQYSFEVDLDKCTGCKACVSACHSLNGLDENEMWRSVGLLINPHETIDHSSESHHGHSPYLQHVTTACHHCVDPGCLNGCPVLAYEKDEATGIVRHLDDQCIGCQYCVMKCPYEVPKYSAKRGIVRKCDMCYNRLASNEAPACVQACPSEAIRITVVNRTAIADEFRGDINKSEKSRMTNGRSEDLQENHSSFVIRHFLPDSPKPQITVPTTRYKSSKPLPAGLLSGDHTHVRPSEPHLPLVFMLVMTQLAVGVSVAATIATTAKPLSIITIAVSTIALGIASLHLGKPLKAWRAFLGWRTSWFSREVIVFSAFVPLAVAALLLQNQGLLSNMLNVMTAFTGLLGVVCSAMIYVDTGREFWNAKQSFGKFLGSTVLLGAATTLAVQILMRPDTGPFPFLTLALLLIATVAKLSFENRIFSHWTDENTIRLTQLNKTAQLLRNKLGFVTRLRIACGIFGGIVLPLLILANQATTILAFVSLGLCIVGELLERCLFFTAIAPDRMPGVILE